jgi:hypothetical protein
MTRANFGEVLNLAEVTTHKKAFEPIKRSKANILKPDAIHETG